MYITSPTHWLIGTLYIVDPVESIAISFKAIAQVVSMWFINTTHNKTYGIVRPQCTNMRLNFATILFLSHFDFENPNVGQRRSCANQACVSTIGNHIDFLGHNNPAVYYNFLRLRLSFRFNFWFNFCVRCHCSCLTNHQNLRVSLLVCRP